MTRVRPPAVRAASDAVKRGENALINKLPRADRLRLLKSCEKVDLLQHGVLGEVGEQPPYVYFPVDGFISLLTLNEGKPSLEVGMAGREGMLGAHLGLGVMTQSFHALVQGSGSAWRISTSSFQRELLRSPALRRVVYRYIYVLMTQLANSAACLRFHQISPRLARWLLMTQDRAHSADFIVTHQYLAYMLGVRRVGVTTAAADLQRQGLIIYSRGRVTILKRPALVESACACYLSDLEIYKSQFA